MRGGGRGTESYDCKKALPSINRSILSGALFRTATSVPTPIRGGTVENRVKAVPGGERVDAGVGW
jgi:hypothetical protein